MRAVVAGVVAAVGGSGVAVGMSGEAKRGYGRSLRTYLGGHGSVGQVGFAAVSEEVGVDKAEPAICRAAMDGLGIDDPTTIVHVGDLKRTDVAGARAMGMGTVRFRGALDDLEDGAEADHVIDCLADLSGLFPELVAGP